jgi:pimeloyl-ACP methyl ester carboxylesterase
MSVGPYQYHPGGNQVNRSVFFSLHVLVRLFVLAALFMPYQSLRRAVYAQTPPNLIFILDRDQKPVTRITDGDQIRLQINLGEKANAPISVDFQLEQAGQAVASCQVPAGTSQCKTDALAALGWRWQINGQVMPKRTIWASGPGLPAGLSAVLQVDARPVVMVHGFSSDWTAWKNYLGSNGYLAGVGLRGFAAGDGQFPGTMNTGSFTAPAKRTNTIAENAAILGQYIANVKKSTGAQQVDLIAHSMGGLISRYYIDRVMQERDVAQLIMLGSPMAGTDCADLPASLGLYLPATLEIRPSYVVGIFNQQITHRHGVPFHALAGVPILDSFKSPCTAVPTDLAVSLGSVTAIPLQATQLPILHIELNTSREVFDQFVKPLLEQPAGAFREEPDPAQPGANQEALQFTRVYTGHIDVGTSQEVVIPIESGVSVASFALYDTTRTISVTVTGASGNTIALNPEKNGLVIVKDPATLFYLGYGFQNPKPGLWRVRLQATDQTPSGGADYAMSAHFVGGATLKPDLNTFLPQVNEEIRLTASLVLNGQPIDLQSAQANIRAPDGISQTLALDLQNGQGQTSWKLPEPGIYGVDVHAQALSADGIPIERTAFLALEVQPTPDRTRETFLIAGTGLILLLAAAVAIAALRRTRRRKAG